MHHTGEPMIVQAIFFYLFAGVLIASAVMVIAARNPVHSVLFLFVVMMLDVDFAVLKRGMLQYLPFGLVIAGIFLAELLFVVGAWTIGANVTRAAPIPPPAQVSNTEALGLVLYTKYVYFFELAGMVLLVAMIGAIVLTLQHRVRVKRQDISAQNARTRATAVEMRKVRPGQGLEGTPGGQS